MQMLCSRQQRAQWHTARGQVEQGLSDYNQNADLPDRQGMRGVRQRSHAEAVPLWKLPRNRSRAAKALRLLFT